MALMRLALHHFACQLTLRTVVHLRAQARRAGTSLACERKMMEASSPPRRTSSLPVTLRFAALLCACMLAASLGIVSRAGIRGDVSAL
jgi:hypothetical protein